MYRAKETHADMALYEERHDHHSPAKLALTADLRAAIDKDEIIVWYQPILDLESCEVRAVEALVRWQHPDLGLLLPGSFIDMAEHTNLIKPLTHRVLAVSLSQLDQWRALGHRGLGCGERLRPRARRPRLHHAGDGSARNSPVSPLPSSSSRSPRAP